MPHALARLALRTTEGGRSVPLPRRRMALAIGASVALHVLLVVLGGHLSSAAAAASVERAAIPIELAVLRPQAAKPRVGQGRATSPVMSPSVRPHIGPSRSAPHRKSRLIAAEPTSTVSTARPTEATGTTAVAAETPNPETQTATAQGALAAPGVVPAGAPPMAGVARGGSAKAGSSPAAGAGPQRGDLAASGSDWEIIRSAVVRAIVYPPLARRMGWTGRTLVKFRLQPDGSVMEARVISSSGHSVLDESALTAVHQAAPFARRPSAVLVAMPVVFALE